MKMTLIISFSLLFYNCKNEKLLIENNNSPLLEQSSFELFFDTFSKDCNYQLSHTKFPLIIINQDYETELYDTSVVNYDEYICTRLVNEFNIDYNGNQIIDKKEISSDNIKIIFGIEDTGVHIEYFFKKVNSKWCLIQILDTST